MIDNCSSSSSNEDGSGSSSAFEPLASDPHHQPQQALHTSQPQDSMTSRQDGTHQHDVSSSSAAAENGIDTTSSSPQHPPSSNSSSSYADVVMNGIHDPMTNLAVHSPGAISQHTNVGLLPQIEEQPPATLPSSIPYQQQQQSQLFGVHLNNVSTTIIEGSSTFHQSGGEPSSETAQLVGNTATTNGGNRSESRMSIGSSEGTSSRAMSIDLNRANTPGAMSLQSEDDYTTQTPGNSIGTTGDDGVVVVGVPPIMNGIENALSTIPSGAVLQNGHVPRELRQFNNGNQLEHNHHPPPSSSVTAVATASSTPPRYTIGQQHCTSSITTGMEATAAHERQQSDANSMQLTSRSTTLSPNTTLNTKQQSSSSFSKQVLRSPEHILERLSYILGRGSLVMINFSQRSLNHNDAGLIRSAIISNPQLSVLKLGYNNLGNVGVALIATAIQCGGGLVKEELQRDNVSGGVERNGTGKQQLPKTPTIAAATTTTHQMERETTAYHHHPSLTVLDLGFNNISDEGCTSLATLAVSRNPSLSTLYLSGNAVREQGALALAQVIAGGCGLTSLHLTANRIGPRGVKGLMRSMAEFDVTMQMAQQDRENRLALEELEKRRRMEKLRKEKQDEAGNGGGGDNDHVSLESLGIDDKDQGQHQEPALDDLARLNGFKCMEELYLGGTNMESTGCLSVSNMLLTNLSLRTICLSDNGLNDQDLSLFSQSLSRNRELPLEVLRLSFNKLTCVGVETLMNSIWGSKTLREIKLDNNQIRDRGAQLAAVVLTSVDLEVLDMGFNRLTIVGIKALMKSLAENRSLETLTLSGNVLDTNASKAVSYALAYNKTIRKLYVDHCSLSYAAQRHIAAGIVSNSNLALRVMSGFPLGAISVTLGLPAAMETWSNEQVLKFIRVMWDRYRHEKGGAVLPSSKDGTQSMSNTGGASEGDSASNAATADKSAEKQPKAGPSDPATVVAAAKSAFEALGDAGGALLLTEEPQRCISDSSPMVSSDAVMLEKTSSGTIRVPSLDDSDDETFRQNDDKPTRLDISTSHISLCTANGKDRPETPVDPMAKKRNMDWLRLHFRSLNEIAQLPYVHADLLQLYRYFNSPGAIVDGDDSGSVHDGMPPPPQLGLGFNPGIIMSNHPPESSRLSIPLHSKPSGIQRKISYRGLHDVMMVQSSHNLPSPNCNVENSSKRRPVSDPLMKPATKRARSGKPRIDHFPRLKAKIEQYLSSSKQTKALILLRQLKFVETTMFHAGNPYCDQSTACSSLSEPIATDAEVILIDML